MRVVQLIAAAAMAWSGAPTAAAPASAAPVQWAATGKWNVDFADQRCGASRAFVQGSKTLQIALVPSVARPTGEFWLVVPAFTNDLRGAQVVIAGKPLESGRLTPRDITRNRQFILSTSLTEDEFTRLIESGSVEIRGSSYRGLLTLTSLPQVKKLLDQCKADLLKSWGFGEEAIKLSFQAQEGSRIPGLFSVDDYPAQAIRDNASGTAEVLFTVGKDGRPKNCRVLKSAGHPALDEATCSIILRRARYSPARNLAGDPVEVPDTARISWIIP